MKRMLILALMCVSGASIAGVTMITDFEAFDTTAGSGTVMFKDPGFSGSTDEFVDATTDLTAISDADIAGNTTKKLKVYWKYLDLASPWLRLTTYNTTILPNPAVDFNQVLHFDIYTDVDVYLGIGLRETATTNPIGGNGGVANGIEFVSNVPITGAPGSGQLITANTWTTVTFVLPNAGMAGGPYVKGFAGATGNGVLTSSNMMGALEQLYFVPAGGVGPYTVYLDNFRQAAVPEPMTMIALGAGIGALALRRKRR